MKMVVVGGTGLVGSKIVTELEVRSQQAGSASPHTGANRLTGEGLAGILEWADVVVDVSNSPSFEADGDMALTHLHLRNSKRDASLARSRTNTDDRLPLDALGRIEGGNGVVEVRDIADVRAQASVPHSLDDLTQLGAVGHDNEVDR